MTIILNGKEVVVQSKTLDELVAELGFSPQSLVIEMNKVLVPRERWGEAVLTENDRLELLNFVGGG